MSDNSEDNRDEKDGAPNPSRRRFLKGVGIAGAGAAIADKLWATETEEQTATAPAGSRPLTGTINITLDVNGQRRTAKVEPRTTLLNTLRNNLDTPLTGPKLVCDMGTCGACTV